MESENLLHIHTDTYIERLSHFFKATNPLNIFDSDAELQKAKEVVLHYKDTKQLNHDMTAEQFKTEYYKFMSAFHPETHEKQTVIGRMSFQVPGNVFLAAGMLTFYRNQYAVVFWQWLNQTFNAVVNYTNRSGASELSDKDLAISYVSATSGAVGTALLLKKVSNKMPPLFGKIIPFIALALANCINIPLMRNNELNHGIQLYVPLNEDDMHELHPVGSSKVAAQSAIGMVVLSRIAMASPGFLLPPILLHLLTPKFRLLQNNMYSNLFQLFVILFCMIIATPMCCAIFPQISSIEYHLVEHELDSFTPTHPQQKLLFHKGL